MMLRLFCVSTLAFLPEGQVTRGLIDDFWGRKNNRGYGIDELPAQKAEHMQVPLKAGDCVQAVQDIYFYDGQPAPNAEYMAQKQVQKYSIGKIVSATVCQQRSTCPWTVDWTPSVEGIEAGATYPDQVRRMLWRKFTAQTYAHGKKQCLTVDHPYGKSYKPVVRLAPCDGSDEQVFMTPEPQYREQCSMKSIRFAKDTTKCVSAWHKEAIFLVDCDTADDKQSFSYFNKRLSGMHGRDDMCLGPKPGFKDPAFLSLMNCHGDRALEWDLVELPESKQNVKIPTI